MKNNKEDGDKPTSSNKVKPTQIEIMEKFKS